MRISTIALLSGTALALWAAPLFAQEYTPQLDKIENTGQAISASCYKMDELTPRPPAPLLAEGATYSVFLPLVGGGAAPTCANPDFWVGAVALHASSPLVPLMQTDDLPKLFATDMHSHPIKLTLTRNISNTWGEGLPSPSGYHSAQIAKLTPYTPTTQTVTDVPPPGDRAILEDVNWADVAVEMQRRITRDSGKFPKVLFIDAETPLYNLPQTGAASMRADLKCPQIGSTMQVNIVRVFWQLEGERITSWIEITHSANTLQKCGIVAGFTFLKLRNAYRFFDQVLRISIDNVVERKTKIYDAPLRFDDEFGNSLFADATLTMFPDGNHIVALIVAEFSRASWIVVFAP